MKTKSLTELIEQIPFADRVYTKWCDQTNRRTLKQLEDNPYSRGGQIAQALRAFQEKLHESDRDWVEKIESERKHLLSCQEPLVDGSLGEAGLYDKNKTIEQACSVSKPPKQALQLFLLTRFIRPSNVIELGTNVGISSACIAAAMKLNGQENKLVTLDASPYRQRLAKEIHRHLGLDNVSYIKGLFADTLKPSLMELNSIDLAFIDGHHQYQPTLDYFEEILQFSTPDAVFVFDDIRWSDGMNKAWSRIRSDNRLGLIVDMSILGVCVRRQPEIPQRFVFNPKIRGSLKLNGRHDSTLLGGAN